MMGAHEVGGVFLAIVHHEFHNAHVRALTLDILLCLYAFDLSLFGPLLDHYNILIY